MSYTTPPKDIVQVYHHVQNILRNMYQLVDKMSPSLPADHIQVHYEGEILNLYYPFYTLYLVGKSRADLTSEDVEEFDLLHDLQFLRVYSQVVTRIHRCRKAMLLNHRSEDENEDLVRISSHHLAQHVEFIWPGTYQTGEMIPANAEQLAILNKHLDGGKPVRHLIMKLKLLIP